MQTAVSMFVSAAVSASHRFHSRRPTPAISVVLVLTFNFGQVKIFLAVSLHYSNGRMEECTVQSVADPTAR